MMKTRVVCLVGLSVLAGAAAARAQTADINFLSPKQTITGFGGSTAFMPQMSAAQANTLFGMNGGQLGLSLLRVRIDSSSTTGGANWATELANAQEAIGAGSNVGVFASPWSPPITFVTGGTSFLNGDGNYVNVGGSLNTSHYADYANYLNQFSSYMASGNVSLLGISMQNEPDAHVGYESCGWTAAQLDAWVSQSASLLTNKLIMPESESFVRSLSDTALADPSAVGKISVIGEHLYGASPAYYTNAANANKPVWMTEHYLTPSGSQPVIADGIAAAEEISNSMTVGQWSAYTWWWVAEWNNGGSTQNYGLVTQDPANTPTYYGLALSHFAKFIRPGYVMVSATAPVTGVYDSAYMGNGNYVIVAINSNSSATSFPVSISGATVSSFTLYQTSATSSMAQLSPVSVSGSSFTYTLPAQSITTFVGTSSTTPGFVVTPSANSLSIAQGSTGTDVITVTDLNGFSGNVSLTATSLPSGVTASFGTNPTSGSSVLTLTASPTATTGPATITVTGTSGGITASNSIALTVGVAPGVSSITSGAYYTITNATSGQCINDPGGVTTNSTAVQQSVCSPGNTNQSWQFTTSTTSGYYEIATYASGTAAWNVIGNGVSAGTGIQLYSYSGASNEVFKPLLYGSTGFFELIDHNSGLCVSDPNGSTISGQGVALETCNGSAGELWSLNVPAPANPGFTLTPTAASLPVLQGNYGTDVISVTDTGGFTGSVTLAATGLPNGVTAVFGTNPTTGSSVLTLTATGSATTGPATVTITGTSGTTTSSTTIAINVSTGPSFTLSPSASALSIGQGSVATDTITVADAGGFTGSVTLVATGLPAGVTVGYGTNPTTGSSVLTFTATGAATAGTATVTITGTSGTTTATTTIALTVNTAPSFTVSPSAGSLSVTQGNMATDTVTINGAGGFSGSVSLAATGLPTGVTVGYGTNPTTGSSVLTFTASSAATVGTATVTVTGTSGALTATTAIVLTVNAGPGFTLAPSTSSLAISQGSTATDTVTVTYTGGFSSSVSLVASGLPSGVTAAFGTNPTTGSSVLTFTATGMASSGTTTVTITGTSGATSATTTIALTVGGSSFATGIFYELVNSASNLCANATSNGGNLTQATCTGSTGQQWMFTAIPAHPGYDYPTASIGTNTDWAPSGGSISVGASIQLSSFNSGITTGDYKPTLYSAGLYQFIQYVSTGSGNCVADPSASTVSGTQLKLETCDGSASTLWKLIPVGFTLTPAPPSVSLVQGSTATATVTITNTGGFTGNVTLVATGLPTGVTVAYGTNPTTGSSVLTFTATGTATAGTATVTITGTSGTTTATTTIALTVIPQEYVFVVNSNGTVASLTRAGAASTGPTTGGGIGAAVDAVGNVWSITNGGASVSVFNNVGVLSNTYSGAGISAATALAIDGRGTVWIANSASISALTNVGVAVSTNPLAQAGNLSMPASITVDAAGSLWLANRGNNTVTEIVGVAAPVTTPVVTQVTGGIPGTMP